MKRFILWFKPQQYWVLCFKDYLDAIILMLYRSKGIISQDVKDQPKILVLWNFSYQYSPKKINTIKPNTLSSSRANAFEKKFGQKNRDS